MTIIMRASRGNRWRVYSVQFMALTVQLYTCRSPDGVLGLIPRSPEPEFPRSSQPPMSWTHSGKIKGKKVEGLCVIGLTFQLPLNLQCHEPMFLKPHTGKIKGKKGRGPLCYKINFVASSQLQVSWTHVLSTSNVMNPLWQNKGEKDSGPILSRHFSFFTVL